FNVPDEDFMAVEPQSGYLTQRSGTVKYHEAFRNVKQSCVHLMQKAAPKKELKHLYRASPREIAGVHVPTYKSRMVDGMGDPNTTEEYAQAVEALFSVSYTVKFKVKKELELCDYAVMPLEGLWWAEDFSVFVTGDRTKWAWTMMIMQPDFVEDEVIHEGIE